jgi:copper oxidase (laccase) domain-containing protein
VTPHPDWIVPDWPAPAHVRAVFTTRAGGVSAPPFDNLNLGDHVRDTPASVSANRKIVHDALGVRPVYLQQVHGTVALAIDGNTPDGVVADAAVSAQSGVACTVMVADCLPVLLTDGAGTVVAAAHAGWRGLQQGVLEHTFTRFRGSFSPPALARYARVATNSIASASVASATMAWLGPCIGPQAFEVGPEVLDAFVSLDPGARAMFRPGAQGKWLADLAGLARLRLQALGITRIYGNDGSAAWCTVSNPSRFFSHRRDSVARGGSGRMAACIWLG